jgi:Fibronectin type III domain
MRRQYHRSALASSLCVLASIALLATLGTGVALAADPPTLVQTVPNDGSVLVVWTAPAGNVTGYNVYQQVVTDPKSDLPAATKVNPNPIKETSLLVQGLTNGTCYHFSVSAIVDGTETAKAGPTVANNDQGTKVCVTPQKPTTIPGVTGNFVGMTIGSDYPGSHTVDAKGVITIKASGFDIWNEADGMYFLAMPMAGDITMTVRTVSGPTENPNAGGWEQGGAMIRESLDSASRFAMILVSRANALEFKKRDTVAVQPVNDDVSRDDNTARPLWLRIQRTGDVFKSWYSEDDGKTFVQAGDAGGFTISKFVKEPWVGLAFSGHDEGNYSTVVFDNFKITSP